MSTPLVNLIVAGLVVLLGPILEVWQHARADSAALQQWKHGGSNALVGAARQNSYGNVNLQQKDMRLALDLGRKMGVPVPLGAAANEMLNACRGLGLAHHDFVAVYEVYRLLGGMSQ